MYRATQVRLRLLERLFVVLERFRFRLGFGFGLGFGLALGCPAPWPPAGVLAGELQQSGEPYLALRSGVISFSP